MLCLIRPPMVSSSTSSASPASESGPPSTSASVIGVVVFATHRGERAEAILDLDGSWRCPQLPVLDRVLNILFAPSPREGASPFGHAELVRMAAWIKGEIEVGTRGESPPRR